MSGNRRQYTAEFKTKVVLQVITGEKTSAEICRSHKLHASVLNRWRKEFLDQATTIFETDSEHEADQQRIADLERLVGHLLGVAELWIDSASVSICLEHPTALARSDRISRNSGKRSTAVICAFRSLLAKTNVEAPVPQPISAT
jgi:transposase